MNDGQGEIRPEWISIKDNPPEDGESCIFAHFPICEAPYVGSIGDSEWEESYNEWFTHYMKMNNDFFYLNQ